MSSTEQTADDLLSWAWTIICNVSGGDWERQTREWQSAAGSLRTQYHAYLGTLRKVTTDD